MTIRVVLADDHPVTRAGIRAILEKASDIQVVGEAKDGVGAQQLAAELRPDVLLLDLVMPGPRPAEIARWVRAHCPETETLILTAHDRDVYLADVVEAGTAGFLTKEEAGEALVEAIRRAARGEVLFTREQLARARQWREEVGQRWGSLTAREREVLALVTDGKSNREIAETLVIGEHTVETHVGNLLGKLGVASRAEAVAWVWRHGLAEEMGLCGGNPPDENGEFP
ncbi:MAG TPA: response regulator transcription factor [Chloroflexi bacterium]|nr:response regulator transcription factor [Chloroflexota bacterium]